MVQTLTRIQKEPSTAQRFAQAFANVGQKGAPAIAGHYLQKEQEAKENEALQKLTGQDLSGLSGDMKKLFVEKILPGLQKSGNTQNAIKAVEDLYKSRKQEDTGQREDVFRQIMGEMPPDEGEFTEKGQQELAGQNAQGLWNQLEQTPIGDEGERDPLEESAEKANLYRSLGEKELAEQEFEKGKLLHKKQTEEGDRNFKINEPIFSKATAQARSLKKDAARLDRLGVLEDTGEVPENVKFAIDSDGNLSPKAGLFGASLTPEGHEYVKIVNDFLKDVKDTLGAKVVSNYDIQAYLRTLPTLMQSSEGRRAVLRDLKLMNEWNQAESGIVKSVSDEIGLTASPVKFQKAIDERLAEYEQAVADEYVNPTIGYKVLDDEKMAEFMEAAQGNTPQERIANAKRMASKKGYMVEE